MYTFFKSRLVSNVLNLQSKMTVYAAIGAMVALMLFIIYYSSLDNPLLEQAQIELAQVQVIEVNSIQNKATLQVAFQVTNPSELTFTIPSISYELFADGRPVSAGQYSTEDIAMPGRAAFYSGASIPLKSNIVLGISDSDPALYEDIVNERVGEYSARGIITVESAWAIVEKEFESSLP